MRFQVQSVKLWGFYLFHFHYNPSASFLFIFCSGAGSGQKVNFVWKETVFSLNGLDLINKCLPLAQKASVKCEKPVWQFFSINPYQKQYLPPFNPLIQLQNRRSHAQTWTWQIQAQTREREKRKRLSAICAEALDNWTAAAPPSGHWLSLHTKGGKSKVKVILTSTNELFPFVLTVFVSLFFFPSRPDKKSKEKVNYQEQRCQIFRNNLGSSPSKFSLHMHSQIQMYFLTV